MSYPHHMDGSGLDLAEHARELAERLDLTPEQAAVLVSELRNALVPGLTGDDGALPARDVFPRVGRMHDGARRVSALADAIAARARGQA